MRKHILQLSLISFCFYLPFLNKGVSYDDLVFLDYAKRLTKNPFECVVTDYLFLGVELKDLVVFESTHPPLVPYVLKAGLKLFGENLVMLHLLMYGFLWLATISLAALIKRYTRYSPLCAVVVTLGPLFLPNATSLMTDTALFAFWLAAMACWEQALDGPSRLGGRWQFLTGLFTTCAFFTAYQGLGLLFLLPLMAFARKRLRAGLLWPALALLPFALWLLMVWINYDIVPYFSPPRAEISIANEVEKGLVWTNITLKARAWIFYLGAALVFVLPSLFGRKTHLPLYLAAAGWGLAMVAYLFPEFGFFQTAYASLLAAVGLLALWVVGTAVQRLVTQTDEERRVTLILLTCIGGFGVFQILLASFAAPRYNLIPVAAVLLLAMRRAEQYGPIPKLPLAAILPTLLLGLLVAYAEKDYADAQRVERLPLPEGALHIAGEKGLHYSGEQLGHHYFLPRKQSEIHHLLVPREIDHIPVPGTLLENAELVDTFTVDSALPIRVMNREAQAGFYIHNRGMLPFAFSTLPIEVFSLYKVFHPGHPHWREAEYDAVPAGLILPETPVYQDFTCGPDGLTTFRLMLATHNRVNQSTLIVSLQPLDAQGLPGPAVFQEQVDAATLADNDWRRFDFAPLVSKGKRYRVTLHSPDATASSAVTIWSNKAAPGFFYWGDERKQGALGFETLCAPGTSDH